MNDRGSFFGGERIAHVLEARGIAFVFTLCGGHVSPILVGCRRRGIRVIDVRHEATAVFAADAVARLTGRPGVAVVTAGPGATNTITALKNASMARSPVVLLVGATATALKGRGALQDIDQHALLAPHVKAFASVRRVRDLAPAVELALETARGGLPGPVAIECPVDLLYPESVVRDWYGGKSSGGHGLRASIQRAYLRHHVGRLFSGADRPQTPSADRTPRSASVPQGAPKRIAAELARARRPLLLVGSPALSQAGTVEELAAAVARLGVPVYLSGMARGLLGPEHPLQLRHRRREALREADVVVLAGVPCDFRLDYGRQVSRAAHLIAVNPDPAELKLNRRPDLALCADPGTVLRALATLDVPSPAERAAWLAGLRERDRERVEEIRRQAAAPTAGVNPLALCLEIDAALGEDSVIVADGGDFVATAAYTVRPRGPLGWLDPGPFGTLGVGAGFALGAKLCRPRSEVWILYGDGSLGFTLAEFDTFARHGLPVIAVVGNDGCWSQIAREQVEILGDGVACELVRDDYHLAVEGLGASGLLLEDPARMADVLGQARQRAREGRPVLVNAQIGSTDFRKGSISI